MRIVLFGDSVLAGHGLPPDAAPAVMLADRLGLGTDQVRNAATPDETAGDGLARVTDITGDLVFVEFGLNDAIQGIAASETADALGAIIDHLHRRQARVVLVEALVPGASRWPALTDQAGLAQRVAQGHEAEFCPDVLDYRRTWPDAAQEDGLHPDRTGVRLIVERLAPFAEGWSPSRD